MPRASTLFPALRPALLCLLTAFISTPAHADSEKIESLTGTEHGDEGDSFSWTCEWSDDDDEITYFWDFGDGWTFQETNENGESRVSHAYVDGDATYEVTCVAETEDGEDDDEESLTVTVANAPPVATASGAASGDEGETLAFVCSATDPGSDDTHTFGWVLSDGTTYTGASISHAFDDNGIYTATCTATDNGGDSDSSSVLVTVANVEPTLDSFSVPSSADEGALVRFSASASDPGADTLRYSWEFGDGSVSTSANPRHAYDDDGSYSVTLTVSDGDGGSTSDSGTVTVSNVAPTATLSGSMTGIEGVDLNWTCTVSDDGAGDTHTYAWDFGDGQTDTGPKVSHAYANDGTWTVSCTITDDDGGSGTDTLSVSINNAAPTLDAVSVPSEGDEGEILAFEATAGDSGDDVLTTTWDFGDGTTATGESASHSYADNGIWTVTVQVVDGDLGSVSESHSLTIANVAPSVSATGDESCVEGSSCTFDVVLDDPGTDDTHTWTHSLPDGAIFDEGSLTLSWTPTWEQLGTVPAVLVVTDDDGDSATLEWTFEVAMLDEDGDGLSDLWEAENGLDPTDAGDAAADPDGDGRTNAEEFSLGTDPQSDDGPSTPTPWSPTDGSEWPEERLELVVENAESPTGADLTVRLELYSDETMTTLVAASDDLAQDSDGLTGWDAEVELTENAWYHWWAVASDDWTTGAWSDPASFFYNTVNEAPGEPGLNEPSDGSTVGTLEPDMVLDPALDPDGDPLTYTVVLLDDAEGELTRATGLVAEDSAVVWPIDVTLIEDAWFCWYAWATDDEGLDGPTTAEACFLVDVNNAAPSAPAIAWPAQDDRVWDLTPEIEVINGIDPEGRATNHIFELDTDASFGTEDLQTASVPSGDDGTTTWTPAAELQDDTTWYLRVACTDGSATSEQALTSFRVNSTNDRPTEPTLHNPADGAHVTGGDVFSVINSFDSDDEPLAYEIQITNMNTAEIIEEIRLDEDPSGITSWTPEPFDDGMYIWTARAVDPKDLASDWTTPRSFQVSTAAEVPTEYAEPLSFCGCTATDRPSRVGWGVLVLLLGTVVRRRR